MAEPFLEVAVDAARRAGALLLDRFGSLRQIRYKGSPSNLVTEMDRRGGGPGITCPPPPPPRAALLPRLGGAPPPTPRPRPACRPPPPSAHGAPRPPRLSPA